MRENSRLLKDGFVDEKDREPTDKVYSYIFITFSLIMLALTIYGLTETPKLINMANQASI